MTDTELKIAEDLCPLAVEQALCAVEEIFEYGNAVDARNCMLRENDEVQTYCVYQELLKLEALCLKIEHARWNQINRGY